MPSPLTKKLSAVRQQAEPLSGALVTGSQVYSRPTSSSDLDLVVLVTPEEYTKIVEHAEKTAVHMTKAKHDYPVTSVYFGGLNLIVTVEPSQFDIWRKGTQELLRLRHKLGRPITRDEAVQHFTKLRDEISANFSTVR